MFAWTSVSRHISHPYDLVFNLRQDNTTISKDGAKRFGWLYVGRPCKAKILGNVRRSISDYFNGFNQRQNNAGVGIKASCSSSDMCRPLYNLTMALHRSPKPAVPISAKTDLIGHNRNYRLGPRIYNQHLVVQQRIGKLQNRRNFLTKNVGERQQTHGARNPLTYTQACRY